MSAAPTSDGATPGLSALDDLVERARTIGLTVTVTHDGAQRRVDPSVELTAYRVVQEGLTNAVRYSGPGAAVDVGLSWRESGLSVEVVDDGIGPAAAAATDDLSSGTGLVGLRERVSLIGGSFEAGPRPDGGFRIRALLPLGPALLPLAPPATPGPTSGEADSHR